MYVMTIKELFKTLEQRKKGLSYSMWRLANLIGASIWSKKYPKTPEEATPELYPAKKGIPMPDFLMKEWAKQRR